MYRNPVCPSCSHSFSIRDSVHMHNTKQPLLLQCGHACCENCLNKTTRSKKTQVLCVLCKEVTDLCKAEKGVKSLHPDLFINGVLHVNRNFLLDMDLRRISPAGSAAQKPQRDLVTGGVMKSVLCAECKQEASCRCNTCNVNLCGKCFDKIHGIVGILRSHQARFLTDDELNGEGAVSSSEKMKCPTHNKLIEYFCELDKTLICSTCCISGDHKGHEVISMEDKNKSYIDDLETVAQTAARVLKRLKTSERQLEHCQPDFSSDARRLVEEVRSHFRWLHGCLQVREAEMITEIMDNFSSTHSERSGVVQDMRSQLKQAQSNLSGLLYDAKKVLSNNNDVILNAKDILDQLVEASDMPCSLVCKEKDEIAELKLEWPEDIISIIKDHGSVQGCLEPVLTLVTLSESGPDPSDAVSETCSVVSSTTNDSDVIIEEENEESLSETASSASRPLSRQSSTSTEPPKSQQPRSTQNSRKNNKLREVEVTHIRNPSSFMVQQCADMRNLTMLQTNMNKWCNNPDNEKSRPEILATGDLVLAKYTLNDTWYRARVKNVITAKTDADDPEKDVIAHVEVVYFDYGNCESVTIDRVLKMQTRFMKHSDFSLECCLYDIVYLEGESCWSTEAVKTLLEMTEGKKMIMSVIQEVNNVLHVDLCKPASADIKDDCPVSVRDALVFLELANYYSQSHPSVTPPGYTPKRQFLRSEPKRCRETFEVMISHCDSPDSFYVQEMGMESHYLYEMMMQIQEVYGSDISGVWNILYPHKGMVCAAPFEKIWQRAVVLEIPGQRMVKVQYVDYGNKATLPSLHLKKLLDRFLCLPAFAIHCQLADVIPVEEEGWSPQALDWCKKDLERAKCTATVIKVSKEKLHLQLVTVINDLQYCVNWKLVKDKLAVSTGRSSKIVTKKDSFVDNNPFLLKRNVVQAEADTTSNHTETSGTRPKKSVLYRKKDRQEVISSFLDVPGAVSSSSSMSSLPTESGEENLQSSRKPRQSETGKRPSSKSEVALHQSTDSKESLSSSQKESTEEETKRERTTKKKTTKKKRITPPPTTHSLKVISKPERKTPLGIRIVVTHCESPSKIYIQMATAQRDGLDSLTRAMKEAYTRTSPCLVTWKPDDYCAAKGSDDQWYRGKVVSTSSDSKVEVFMEDYGFTEEVDTSNLQGLSDKFIQNYGSFCQKCHIADITPTGGLKNWSQTSVELVRSEVCRKTCYLVKKGEKDDTGSQPIDLLIEIIIEETALEPASKDYYSLCEKLKQKGLAMPVRKKITKADLMAENPATAALAALSQKSPEKSQDGITSPTSPTSPIVEPMIMLKPPCVFYKLPEMPTVKSLSVIPTYVDYGCIIFLHLMGRNDETDQLLTQVVESMQTYFNQPTLYSASTEWKVGQGCAAYYSVDKHWYRGKVIEVPTGGDKLRVQYIDYGNSVWLSKDMVRADVNQFVDIPHIAVECVLHRIQPSADQQGTWNTSALETIHDLLVNKDCTAEIEDCPEGGPLSVRLFLNGEVDVGEYLCGLGLAARVEDIKEKEEKSRNILSILNDNNPYDGCFLPAEDKMFSVVITHVDMPDVVYFQRGRPGLGETDDYSNKVCIELNLLVQLTAEINQFAPTAVHFEKPRPGAPCCAQFSFDNCWYRALMISVNEDKCQAFVYFVDYGNSECVSFDKLRIMPAQFMLLPAQSTRCRISNIAPPRGKSWSEDILQAMIRVVSNCDIKAQLTCSRPELTAVLYKNSDRMEFIYQSLLDQGQILLKESNVNKTEKRHSRDWSDMAEENEEIDYLNDIELDSSTDTTLEDNSEDLHNGRKAASSNTAKKSDNTGDDGATDSEGEGEDDGGDDDDGDGGDDVEWETTEGESEGGSESNT